MLSLRALVIISLHFNLLFHSKIFIIDIENAEYNGSVKVSILIVKKLGLFDDYHSKNCESEISLATSKFSIGIPRTEFIGRIIDTY